MDQPDGDVGSGRPERGLTHDQVAEVLRRAAELDGDDEPISRSAELVAPSVVEDAAVEAGLSRTSVRRALQELAISPGHPIALSDHATAVEGDRITVVRSVSGSQAEVTERIERYLRRQLFVRERIFDDGSWWCAKKGTDAKVRRDLDLGGKLALRSVGSVEVRVVDDPTGASIDSLVRVDLDISRLRRRRRTAVTRLGTVGAAAAGVAALLDPVALLFVAPASVGITARGHVRGGRSIQRSVDRIEVAVHGLLDRIEHDVPDERALRGSTGSRTDRTGPRSHRASPRPDRTSGDAEPDRHDG
ncbi:MAG: hypothetical protein JJE52_16760 [Acidimicrobiia bacterium]|nr:hypothetical protein [Acidimicrobiia bacterium]